MYFWQFASCTLYSVPLGCAGVFETDTATKIRSYSRTAECHLVYRLKELKVDDDRIAVVTPNRTDHSSRDSELNSCSCRSHARAPLRLRDCSPLSALRACSLPHPIRHRRPARLAIPQSTCASSQARLFAGLRGCTPTNQTPQNLVRPSPQCFIIGQAAQAAHHLPPPSSILTLTTCPPAPFPGPPMPTYSSPSSPTHLCAQLLTHSLSHILPFPSLRATGPRWDLHTNLPLLSRASLAFWEFV